MERGGAHRLAQLLNQSHLLPAVVFAHESASHTESEDAFVLDDSCTVWKMHTKRSGVLSMGAQGCGGTGKECKAHGTVNRTPGSCTCKQAHDTCASSAGEEVAGSLSSSAGVEEVKQVIKRELKQLLQVHPTELEAPE